MVARAGPRQGMTRSAGVARRVRGVDIGVVLLPDLKWPLARDRWREAEARGFSTAWTYDHLSWRSLRDGPWFGAVPLLAGVAALTSSIRLGTLVATPNFRHPAVLAKEAMTLDHLSEGRFELGLGAGGVGFDATVLGGPPLALRDRATRFEEFVDALDVLLREPSASFEGSFFSAVDARTLPGCLQTPRVPFTVAAVGPRAIEVAARHGRGWVTFGPLDPGATRAEWLKGVSEQAARFRRACEVLGRPLASCRRYVLASLDLHWTQGSIQDWDDFCGGLEELGFTDVLLHWPRPHDTALPGPTPSLFDEVSSRLR